MILYLKITTDRYTLITSLTNEFSKLGVKIIHVSFYDHTVYFLLFVCYFCTLRDYKRQNNILQIKIFIVTNI